MPPMPHPDSFDPHAYVAAAAPLLGLTLDASRAARVAEALALVIRTARPALECPVTPQDEPAPVFRP